MTPHGVRHKWMDRYRYWKEGQRYNTTGYLGMSLTMFLGWDIFNLRVKDQKTILTCSPPACPVDGTWRKRKRAYCCCCLQCGL